MGKVQMVAVRRLVVLQMKGAVTSYMVKMDRKLRVACEPKTIFTNLRV